jgi:hypothetical protein
MGATGLGEAAQSEMGVPSARKRYWKAPRENRAVKSRSVGTRPNPLRKIFTGKFRPAAKTKGE